jgi:methionine--tRNA ligase beta chain
MASIDDLKALGLRVGVIEGVEVHEGARKPMYKLTVDLGQEIGKRTIVAGIGDIYTKEQLLGKRVVCVANLEPKMIAGVESQGMLLAADDGSLISLLTPDKEMPAGSTVR